ncbi:MAG: hypothetical protein QM817_29600 [Archangium sp.]
MRRAALALMVMTSSLSACVPPERTSLVDPTAVDGLCWWRGVKWDGRGALRVRRTGELLGYAHPRWTKTDLPDADAMAWKGATASGVLRLRGDHVVFEGQWYGGGLTLAAEANATEDALFTLWLPTKLSNASLVMRGAPVRLGDARVGQAMVLPSSRSLETFVPDEVPSGAVPCDGLALRASQAPPAEPRALVNKAGFTDAKPVRVKVDKELGALPASDTPNGEFVGGFVPDTGSVFEVARNGDSARLVAVSDGTLWVGWVDADFVQPLDAEQTVKLEPKRAQRELDRPTWRACEREQRVWVNTPKGPLVVGVMERNTRFALTGQNDFTDEGELISIWPGVEWFEPGMNLLVRSEASSCPVVTTGAW